jgi:hypothetical protein
MSQCKSGAEIAVRLISGTGAKRCFLRQERADKEGHAAGGVKPAPGPPGMSIRQVRNGGGKSKRIGAGLTASGIHLLTRAVPRLEVESAWAYADRVIPTCQACNAPIESPGSGRRYCFTCSPPAAMGRGKVCLHGLSVKMLCSACTWEKDFYRRRYASIASVVDAGHTGEDLYEADLAECRRAIRREVAAVRRLALDDEAERDRRIETVKEQIRTEMSDVRNDWQYTLLNRAT